MPKNSKGREIAEIIPAKCIGCERCLAACPVPEAMTMEGGVAIIFPEVCIGCGRCFDACPTEAIIFERVRKKKAAKPEAAGAAEAAASVDGHKGVAVFIEVYQGHGAEVSWELMGKARELADKLGTQVLGFLLGHNVKPVAEEAIAHGCDTVYMADSPAFQVYLSKLYGRAVAKMCQQVKPEILLLGATAMGRDLSGVVATILHAGLTADCTGLDIDMEKRLLLMTRPTFGGSIMATIVCQNQRPQMSTVRPRVMKLPRRDPGRKGEIRTLDLGAQADSLPQVIEFMPKAHEVGGVDITKAPVLVVVGKGACDSRHLPMLEDLARLLGGAVGCSRAVVQAGMLPYVRQVGQTGKTVAPSIYIGVGVSGAVQHLVGMQGSDRIIAINTDPHAPMMQIADYALVGDYLEVVPRLIKGIEARLPSLKGVSS
ncbi:MAG: 4Fe-4S binding protein [Chloroflexi bacterium]|nr:4Fe-4S binding protein [Chloroflexota bacterium]